MFGALEALEVATIMFDGFFCHVDSPRWMLVLEEPLHALKRVFWIRGLLYMTSEL
jgi:hypothetical protein